MKKVKKALGAVLALSMLLTSVVVMPLQSSAANYPELETETFDDWSDDVAGVEVPSGSVGQHGWTRFGSPSTFTGQIDDERGNKYLTLTTTWAGAGVSFANAAKDGVYKINASIKVNDLASKGKAAVMLGDATLVTPLLLQGDGTVRTGSTVGTDPNNITDTVNNPIGKYDPEKWVDVEIIHNMDIGKTSMVLYQNNVEIAHKYLTDTSGLGMVTTLGFKYISDTGSMSIDNVSVKRIFDTDGLTVYAEDFNGTASVDQIRSYLVGKNGGLGNSANISEGALNIPTNWEHISPNLGDIHGNYTLTFKIKSEGVADVRLQNDGVPMDQIPLMVLGAGKVWIGEKVGGGYGEGWFTEAIYNAGGNEWVTPVAEYDVNEWVDVTAVFDTANSIMSTKIEQNGVELANFPVRGVHGLYTDQGLRWVRLRAINGAAQIDDIKLVCGGSVADGATVMVDEDFDDFSTDSTQNRKNGWIDGFNKGIVPYSVVPDENGGQMIKLEHTDQVQMISYSTTSCIDRGDVTIDFDLKLDGDTPNFLVDLANSSTENSENFTGTTAIRTNGFDGLVTTQYHNGTGTVLANFEKGKWYHYTITVHPKKSAYDVKMYEDDGTTLVAEMSDIPMNCTDAQNVQQTTFKAVRFRLWNASNQAYIDNFKMTYDVERPKLDESSVTMVDSTDAVVTNYDKVDSALKTITLDYGTELASVGTVTLADATGDTVDFTGEIVGETYVMILDEILKDETDYTLSASGAIGINGNAQDMDLAMTFTTGQVGSDIVRLGKLTNDAGDITSLSQLSGAFTVNTTAVNRTDVEKDLTWIVAYYNGDRLVDAQTQTAKLSPNTALRSQPKFTVPDMTDVTKVKVFLWNTLDNMVPYCEALELAQ